jgi:hypothetical protein
MILNTKSLVVAYTQALADHHMVATWVLADRCPSFPNYLKDSTRLNIGLNDPAVARDLRVDEQGISVTLSFNRTPHFVMIPWDAVQGFMDAVEADRQIAEGQAKVGKKPVENKRVEARVGNVVKVRFGR